MAACNNLFKGGGQYVGCISFKKICQHNSGFLIGRFSVIYEITEKKQAQQEFLKNQWKLAIIEERERMARAALYYHRRWWERYDISKYAEFSDNY